MPSDRSRTSDDLRQHYQAVVTQQGRVILDRDFNALQGIVEGQIAADALDEIGPCGTPKSDPGFAISLPTAAPSASFSFSTPKANPWDFLISPGTMYIGGQRVILEVPRPTQPAWSYFHQPDWLSPDEPTGFGSASFSSPGHEYIYLQVFEQEVGAVEDPDLLDVALGGPDTTQRIRLMKRIKRLVIVGTDCASALAEAQADWLAQGFAFDSATNRLVPQAKLQVSFGAATTTPNPCDPVAQGGYLGAENQLIRVQIADPAPKGQARLLWGFDNASFLYRVSVQPDGKTLLLAQTPVDAFHSPKTNQIVEILRTTTLLDSAVPVPGTTGQPPIVRCVANATGLVGTVGSFNNGDTLVLTTALPLEYRTDSNPLFLRVWQGQSTFDPTSNQPIILTDPTNQTSIGVQVTITSPGTGATLPVGAFWMFALRPSTSQAVYPQRFLAEPQPPDGPRQWVCPLAVIEWPQAISVSVPVSVSAPAGSVPTAVHDCRQPFDNLVTLSTRQSGGCCTITVFPTDAQRLQTLLDQAVIGGRQVTVCFASGTYFLVQPLRLTSAHSHLTLEACQGGATLQADPGANVALFADGLMVMLGADHVTLHGLTIVPSPVPLVATLDKLNVIVLIGLRPANCRNLTLENCQVQFASLAVAPNQFVFGAGVYLAGDCTGLVVRGSQFASQIPLTSTLTTGNQQPTAIAAGRDGKVWFTVQGPPAKIGMIDPKTHQISLFPIPTPGSFPQGLVVGPDGNLWFLETQPSQIAMFNPKTHQVTEFPYTGNLSYLTGGPDGNIWMRDTSGNTIVLFNVTTHGTSIFSLAAGSSPQGIAVGSDGNIWFTESANKIGMINPKTLALTEFGIPTANSGPGKIVTGPDGNLYFLETSANKIGSLNINTKQVTEVATPTTPSFPSDLAAGPDGNVWFVEGEGKIGMLNVSTKQITEFTPTANSNPAQIVAGSDGNLWFLETGTPNRIGTINPSTKLISEIAIPTASSGLGGLVTGSDGNLWFTEQYSSQIGTINLQTRTISEFPIIASAPSIVAIAGILAFPVETFFGFRVIVRDVPYLNEVSIRDNSFSNLTLPVYAQASFGGCQFQNNSVIACFSGFSLQAFGSGLTASLSDATSFSEYQLTGALARTYELPDGFSRIFPAPGPRISLTISNNRIAAQPGDPSTYSTAALLIAVYQTPLSAASLLITSNDVNARTPMIAQFRGSTIPTVDVGTNVATTITGNVFINVTPNNNHIDGGQAYSLMIVPDSTGSTAGLTVTGNVLVGKSNLSTLLRTDAAAPLNVWTPFNSSN